MTNTPKNRDLDKRPTEPQGSSDLNDPTKAPGTGISPQEDVPQSESARDLAEDAIDKLSDDRASDAEIESRKRELLDGPAELRKARRDIEK